jgi:hypothetical protein
VPQGAVVSIVTEGGWGLNDPRSDEFRYPDGDESAELANFYTVHEYIALPGDRVMYYAGNKETGIGCPGRETFDLALQDAEALNAAVKKAGGGA